jgi:hypothetical protein
MTESGPGPFRGSLIKFPSRGHRAKSRRETRFEGGRLDRSIDRFIAAFCRRLGPRPTLPGNTGPRAPTRGPRASGPCQTVDPRAPISRSLISLLFYPLASVPRFSSAAPPIGFPIGSRATRAFTYIAWSAAGMDFVAAFYFY